MYRLPIKVDSRPGWAASWASELVVDNLAHGSGMELDALFQRNPFHDFSFHRINYLI